MHAFSAGSQHATEALAASIAGFRLYATMRHHQSIAVAVPDCKICTVTVICETLGSIPGEANRLVLGLKPEIVLSQVRRLAWIADSSQLGHYIAKMCVLV